MQRNYLTLSRVLKAAFMTPIFGNGLFKHRVAREGAGRSGGFRTILIFRSDDRAIFVHGFAKNVQANISLQDLRELRFLAKRVLKLAASELATAIRDGDFTEISNEG